MGLACLIKLVRFLYLVFAVFYTTSVVLMTVYYLTSPRLASPHLALPYGEGVLPASAEAYFLVHCTYYQFSKWRPCTILYFKIFCNLCWKFKLSIISTSIYRIWWKSLFKMVAVRHLGFHIFALFVKNSYFYFYVHMQNLVKIGWSAAKLLRIFDFQNGGSRPSWIWYDVISDNPWLVFDGPKIILKLHVDRVYTFQVITIFIFDPFG